MLYTRKIKLIQHIIHSIRVVIGGTFMKGVSKEKTLLENTENQYIMPKSIQDSFKIVLKRGIYKELYQRGLLSDEQLNSLLKDK